MSPNTTMSTHPRSAPQTGGMSDVSLHPSECVQILLVEDNSGDARLVLELLRDAQEFSFEFTHRPTLATALTYTQHHPVDVVLLDLSLPDQQGLATVTEMQAAMPHLPIVVLSGLDDDVTPLRALQSGAQDYLIKGESDSRSLVRSIRYAIERQRLQTALKQAQQEQAALYQQVQSLNTNLEQQVQERTQQLSQEKALLEAILNSIQEGIVVAHPDGTILLTNPTGVELYSLDQVEPDQLYTSDGSPIPATAHPLHRTLQGDSFTDYELRVRSPQQAERWISISGSAIRDDRGTIQMGVTTTRDISDRKRHEANRKQAEDALRQSEATKQAIINAIPDMLFCFDHRGTYLSYIPSRETEPILPPADLLGRTMPEVLPAPVAELFMAAIARALATEETQSIEYQLTAQGQTREYEARLVVSGVDELLCMVRDITARKGMEQALRNNEANLFALIENTQDHIWSVDQAYRIVTINSAFRLAFQAVYEVELQPGMNILDAVNLPEIQQLWQRLYDRAYQGERVITELDYKHTQKQVEVALNPIWDSQQQVCGISVFARDITTRKQTENLLLRQQQVLELIATGAPLPEVLTMLCCIVEEQCPQMLCSILLLDADSQQLHHAAAPRLPADYVRLIDGSKIGPQAGSCGTAAFLGQPVVVTDVLTHPFWVDYREIAQQSGLRACWSLPIFSEQGKVLGTFGMYYPQPREVDPREWQLAEITARLAGIAIEREQAEEALRFTQFCVDRAADAIFWAGPQAELIYVNDAACRSVGYSRDELLTMQVHDISPRSSPETWEVHWEDVKQRGSFTLEGCQQTKAGRVFPTEMTVNYVNFNGREYVCNFVRDITARKQAEENLRQSEARFRSLVRNAADGIVVLNADGTILYESPSVQRRLAYQPEELVGRHLADLLHPEDRDRILAFFDQGLAQPGTPMTTQYRIRHKDGSWRYMEAVGCNLLSDPSVAGIVVNVRDITDRHHYEMELCRTRDAAEAGSRAKSEFLAVMSHELRTPLNAILGLSELLRQELFGALNEKQQEYVQCIYSSGEHLLCLINDILDLSKIEAGREELLAAPIIVTDLCTNCFAMIQERAQAAGLQLTSQISPRLYAIVADERRLRQMLLNLLSNAIKFTPQGTVSLLVHPQDQGVAFTVVDTGIGIAPEHLPAIFEPFHQVDSRLNRRFEGTGLGLALTQRLALLHGGSIHVESELGLGSRFTLYIPTQLLPRPIP